MHITEDGDFIAYKIVRNDYKDLFTGTFDNSVNQVVHMNENEIDDDDDDRTNTCSAGLHVCSKAYLSHFAAWKFDLNRVMIVKINPAHVVAVPADYNDAKMRVYQYTVIGEMSSINKAVILKKREVFSKLSDEYDGDDDKQPIKRIYYTEDKHNPGNFMLVSKAENEYDDIPIFYWNPNTASLVRV